MTHANLYVIFFGIYVIGSVFDYFAGDVFGVNIGFSLLKIQKTGES